MRIFRGRVDVANGRGRREQTTRNAAAGPGVCSVRRKRRVSTEYIHVAAAAAPRLSRHGVAATRAVGSRAGDASFYEIEFSANKDLCRRLDIKKLPCVQFFRGAEGCVATVMCGPSKFPEVREKLVELLGDEVHGDDVPEFTDVSEHYKSKSGDAQPDAQPV